MRYKAFWVYRGPNVYSNRPVIRYQLDLVRAGNFSPDLHSSADRLLAILPGLCEHSCDVQALLQREGDDAGRTPLLHLFEHLCMELQNLTGPEFGCVRAQGIRIARGDAVIPYEDESTGLEAGKLSLELIESLSSVDPSPGFDSRLQAFFQFAERRRLPAQDAAMVRAAEARDIPVIRIVGRLIQLGHGRNQQRMNATETARTSIVSNDLAANKDYQRRVLRALGLPVPRYERVQRPKDAVAAAKRIGFPVVVKPNEGNMGLGVSVGMRSAREVREAFERIRQLGRRSVLVEEYVAGTDYRMLVINGKLEAAARRTPAHVVGDGLHTIEELVHRANLDPRRGDGHRSSWTRIDFVDESDRLLAELGFDRNSIAAQGQNVYLKRIANTSAGGTAVDVTDQVHPENREIAERSAMAVGLDVAGVDLLVPDITQPLRAQGGVICEINSRPGLRKHLWPAEGRPRDVVGAIVEMLFPPGSRSRIPIAVVTGLGNTTGAARMLAELLADDGSTVGLATQDGVFLNGRRADGGGMKGPSATRMLLLDPAVELAVIDLPLGEALRHGLGYDWADACAIINDRPIEPPALIDALSLVVASARSHVVMSAEDEERYGLKPHPGGRVLRVNAGDRTPANGDLALYAGALALCLGRGSADIERRLGSLPPPLSNSSP